MKVEIIPIKEKRYLYCEVDSTRDGWNKWTVVKNVPSIYGNRLRYSVDKLYKVKIDKEWIMQHIERKESYDYSERVQRIYYQIKYLDILRAVAKELKVNEYECLFAGEYQYYGDWHVTYASSIEEFRDFYDNDACIFCCIKDIKPITSKKEQEHIEQIKTNRAELKVINTMLSGTISSVIADMGMCIFGTDPNHSTLGFKDGDAFKQYVMKCITRDLKEKLGEAGIDILKINKPRTSCRIEATHKWVNMKELRMKKE